MTQEQVIQAFHDRYKESPQYLSYLKNPVWVTLKSNTGRPGETWFKKGDLTFVSKRISNYNGRIRLTAFSYRKNCIDHVIGMCEIAFEKVRFINKAEEEEFKNFIANLSKKDG